MIKNKPSNVSSSFEMLLEEVEVKIAFVKRIGSRAGVGRDFRKVEKGWVI